MVTDGKIIAWQSENGDLLQGVIIKTGDRFYTVALSGASYKRKNARKIPIGTKFLVKKDIAQFQNPNAQTVSRCKKILAESERERSRKPTISHYRDMEKNPKTKTTYWVFITPSAVPIQFDSRLAAMDYAKTFSKNRENVQLQIRTDYANSNEVGFKSLWYSNGKRVTGNPDYKNPKYSKKDLDALINKIKDKPYGLPVDQLTIREKAIIRQLGHLFENDKGYIKIKKVVINPADIIKLKKQIKLIEKRLAEKDYASTKARDWMQVGLELAKLELRQAQEKKTKNFSNADFTAFQKKRLSELSEMFQGEANGIRRRVIEPDIAPREKYRLGHLVLMKIKRNGKVVDINFDGESYLAGDLRNNLWAVGKDARIENIAAPRKGTLQYIGDLIQVDYVTAKKHIENGKTVRFWHPLGEVNKEYPKLFIDSDKFPIIQGGGYDVWEVGIVN